MSIKTSHNPSRGMLDSPPPTNLSFQSPLEPVPTPSNKAPRRPPPDLTPRHATLPPEIFVRIFGFVIKDRKGRNHQPILPLLCANRTIYNCLIPVLYKHVKLYNVRGLCSFYTRPKAEHYRYMLTLRAEGFMTAGLRLEILGAEDELEDRLYALTALEGEKLVDSFPTDCVVYGSEVLYNTRIAGILHAASYHYHHESLHLPQPSTTQPPGCLSLWLASRRRKEAGLEGIQTVSIVSHLDLPYFLHREAEAGKMAAGEHKVQLIIKLDSNNNNLLEWPYDPLFYQWSNPDNIYNTDRPLFLEIFWLLTKSVDVVIRPNAVPHLFCGMDMENLHPKLKIELKKRCTPSCTFHKTELDQAFRACLAITAKTTEEELRDLIGEWVDRLRLAAPTVPAQPPALEETNLGGFDLEELL